MCQELRQNFPPNPKTCINPLLGKWRSSFLVRAKYRSETRLFEAATWQPGERSPAREESIHVIMRTHVACVRLSCIHLSLLPQSITDMALIQPGMQERCHGFHTHPKSAGLETLRCGALVLPPSPLFGKPLLQTLWKPHRRALSIIIISGIPWIHL